MTGLLGGVDYLGRLLRDDHPLSVHAVLGKVLHVYLAELSDTHVYGDERLVYILEYHPVEQFAAEMRACGGHAHRSLVLCEDCLEILLVSLGHLVLHEQGHRGLSQAEQGLLELVIWTVIKETQGPSAGGGVVDDFGHQAVVLAKVELVAYADLAGGIDYHVPEPLLLVQFPEHEYHDVRAGLFLLAVETGGEHFGVVEDKGVSLSEIINDILEDAVLYFSGFPVEYHQFAFVTPSCGLCGYAVLWKAELELR